MITVLAWWWAQPGCKTTYTREHVLIWADMVRRNLSMPHRIACVTDLVDELPGIEIIAPPRDFEHVRIPSWDEGRPQCLRRLVMFSPDAGALFGERFVCMDLDCIIGGSLDPLFDRSDDFVIFEGTSRTRPYNGSMMLLKAGARPQLYTDFTPERAAEAGKHYLGSDQAWIAHKLGWGEKTFSASDGVNHTDLARRGQNPLASKRILFFPGTLKPWDLIHRGGNPWAESHYRRDDRSGRALVIGYAPGVWEDVAAALPQGPFETVIAAPESAAHWPKPVDAIAMNDPHALRIARMLGYPEPVACGLHKRNAA